MAHDIEIAFVKQFEREVHEAYQRQGSLLRGTVRTKNSIVGASTTFQKVAKGAASQKARHGRVSPMNLDHSNVECFLADWYAGDWVDKLDELKINHDERGIVVNAGAWALGRKTDEMITTALDTAGSPGAVNLSTFDIAALTAWVTDLGAKDVSISVGDVFCVVSWKVWSKIITLQQFSSAEYVGADLPFKMPAGQQWREWMGVVWMPFTGLSGAATAKKCHMYHRTAVGHAIGAETSTDITWQGPEVSYWINNMMSQGAVLIDGTGVEVRVINENA